MSFFHRHFHRICGIRRSIFFFAAYCKRLFIYLFNDNHATGGSLTGEILCHVELSKYNNARKRDISLHMLHAIDSVAHT